MSAISGFCEKCNKFRKRHCDGNRNTCMSILFDTIEALQQDNEQLQAKLDEWKYEAKCHMDEVAARDKEIERLKAQVDTLSATVNMLAPDEIGKECRHIEALRKAREALERVQWIDNYGGKRGKHCDYCARNPEEGHSNRCIIGQAIAAIDKVLGGKEDVTSMGD